MLELAVPCSDNGRHFVEVERLKLIEQMLSGSDYVRLGDLPLAKVYGHRRLVRGRAIILVSCHIDSLYDSYYAELNGAELRGTFDNSACNAILVEAMVSSRLPPEAIISFTGDEEDESRGADQTVDYLDREGLFQNLEMVLTLDLTEEFFGPHHFSIENYFIETSTAGSVLHFDRKADLKRYLRRFVETDAFLRDADPDESWQYDEHDLNCFSLCLPCRVLGRDMHARQGVAIRAESPPAYLGALSRLAQGVADDLAQCEPVH
jgi:hypothetical protein